MFAPPSLVLEDYMSNRTYVYIDGLNLYNGALKNTSYKWLDNVSDFPGS